LHTAALLDAAKGKGCISVRQQGEPSPLRMLPSVIGGPV
jgi:hypothetical protein